MFIVPKNALSPEERIIKNGISLVYTRQASRAATIDDEALSRYTTKAQTHNTNCSVTQRKSVLPVYTVTFGVKNEPEEGSEPDRNG